jgi:SAM-dependent methyltransferase
MTTINQCPVCGNNSLNPLLSCIDQLVSHETFSIVQCTNCQLAITTPRPDDSDLPHFYESDDYISHSGKSRGLIGILYRLARKVTLTWKYKVVKRYASQGEILDFGCGSGEFLATMKAHQWKISGIEPSEKARLNAHAITGIAIASSLQQLSEKKFNAITLWHVLEHVPDLNGVLIGLKNILLKDGLIFIAVPNHYSPDSEYYNQYWAGYDVPRHLWHFSKDSMKLLLEKNGFELIGIKGMIQDAFYVSMLSERYRGASSLSQLLKGFIQGIRSNIKAAGNNNYSSMLYIARNS